METYVSQEKEARVTVLCDRPNKKTKEMKMKKLMIVLAVVVFAASANAAAIDWKVSAAGVKGYNGSAQVNIGSGATVYLVLSSAMGGITSAINDGTFSASTTGVLGSQQTTGNTGVTGTGTVSSGFGSAGVGDSVDFRVLVVDSTHDVGNTWYKFSGTVTQSLYDETATPAVPTTATFSSTVWGKGTEWAKSGGSSDVPEPTSGLLLVLGGAMLALRRKNK